MKIYAALGTIYVVWGSTFLAIEYAVRTLPPFLSMAGRHLVAGSLLLAWALARRPREPIGRAQILAATIFGGALFLGSHGGLAWSQTRIPSGVAALIVASIPLWIAILDRVAFGKRLSTRAVAGLLLGFAGITVLVDPLGGGPIDTVGGLVALASAGFWAAGSLYSRGAPLPKDSILSAGLASLAGGVLLLAASGLGGELAGLDAGAISAESLAGVGYLIVMGSLVGLTAYVWLLRVAPISLVATYAYVNPVVAVLLGWAVIGETVSARVLLAGAAIVIAVALIVSAPAARRADGRGLLRRRPAAVEDIAPTR